MPNLPDELWLSILGHLQAQDLWLSVRVVNIQLRHCAEELFTKKVISAATVNLRFSLGGGSHHRWYDIRAMLMFNFSHIDMHDKGRAVFNVHAVHPTQCYDRALEKWERMRAEGAGSAMHWLIELNTKTFHVPLSELRIFGTSNATAISYQWRPTFNKYFWEAKRATSW